MPLITYIICNFAANNVYHLIYIIIMERKSYRVDRDTELGRKLAKYNKRALRCNRASDSLAAELGAKEYIFDPHAEVGGIGGLFFDDGHTPDERIWQWYEVDDEQRSRAYLPRLQARVGFAEECEEPESTEGIRLKGERMRILRRHLRYEQVMYSISESDATRITGINLRRQNLFHLMVYSGVPAEVVHRIRTGLLPISALEAYQNEHIPALREAILTFQQMDRSLMGREYFEYLCYRGEPRAADIYERIAALPSIPAFTLNRLFGYLFDNTFRVSFEVNSDGSFTVTELVDAPADGKEEVPS